MACYVCLSRAVQAVKCANGSCEESICKECFRQYLEFCIKSSSLAYCPCESTYNHSTVERTCQKEAVDKYEQVLLKVATLSVDNFDGHLLEKESILATYRAEKTRFMNTLPKGFAFVLNVSMKDKVKK